MKNSEPALKRKEPDFPISIYINRQISVSLERSYTGGATSVFGARVQLVLTIESSGCDRANGRVSDGETEDSWDRLNSSSWRSWMLFVAAVAAVVQHNSKRSLDFEL